MALTEIKPVPDGTILFHVGFHKTGTTALQSALAASRADLRAHGALYPGNVTSHHRAAMAVTQRVWGWSDRGGAKTRSGYWSSLVRESLEHPGRVMISSESFSLADGAAVDRIIERLGADRLHAVFTLRPMCRLLPSSWQQYLKYGLDLPYEQWLREVFKNPPKCAPSPNFWRRNDHAGVIGRWAERLGPDRATLVVLDEGNRRYLFDTFEAMLGMPQGSLVPDAGLAKSNRSMTAAEAEMLRLVNAGGAKRWDWPQYEKLVRRGAILRMVETRTPDRDEELVGTPQWAIEAAQEVGRRTAERVAAMGITVHGDPASLGDPMRAGEPPDEALRLPVWAAAEAVLGAISGSLTGKPVPPEDDEQINKLRLPAVQTLTTRDAAELLRKRMAEARAWRVKRMRRVIREKLRRT